MIFGQVIPKYKILVEEVLANKQNNFKSKLETYEKLQELYKNFSTEYKLNFADALSDEKRNYWNSISGTQLEKDIYDTADFIDSGIMETMYAKNPDQQTDIIMDKIIDFCNLSSDPYILIIIALFFSLVIKYGHRIIKWVISKLNSNDKFAIAFTAIGLGSILFFSTLIW